MLGMKEVLELLEAEYQDRGFNVANVSKNRSRVRIVLRDSETGVDELRSITYDVIDEGDVFGWDMTTEGNESGDSFQLVITFRYRR